MRAWEECLFIADTLFGQASNKSPESKNACSGLIPANNCDIKMTPQHEGMLAENNVIGLKTSSATFDIIIKEVSSESLRNGLPKTRIVSVVNQAANTVVNMDGLASVSQPLAGNSATFCINFKKATHASQLDGSSKTEIVSAMNKASDNSFDYNANGHAAIANAKYPIVVLADISRSAKMTEYIGTRAIKRKLKTQDADSELPNKKKK